MIAGNNIQKEPTPWSMIKARIFAILKFWLLLLGITVVSTFFGTATGLSKTDPQPPWQFSQLWQEISTAPIPYLLGMLGASLLITGLIIVMDKSRRDFVLFGKHKPSPTVDEL